MTMKWEWLEWMKQTTFLLDKSNRFAPVGKSMILNSIVEYEMYWPVISSYWQKTIANRRPFLKFDLDEWKKIKFQPTTAVFYGQKSS